MLTKNNSALLVMDVQEGIVKGLGDKAGQCIAQVTEAVKAAHAANLPVFFIVIGFREGYPEMHRRNKMFERITSNPQFLMPGSGAGTQPVITPQTQDVVVVKKRVSAFAGSDLEMLLRARDITNLVLCGIATSGVVLSTVRHAADKDYEITVLSDCCADRDDEVHRVLLEKVFPNQANVMTANDWIKTLT